MSALHVVAWLIVAVILAWRVALPLWRHWRAPVERPAVVKRWPVSIPVKAMPGFRERLCRCNMECPFGRIGSEPRCKESELRAAGVAVQVLEPEPDHYAIEAKDREHPAPRIYPPMPHLNKWKVSNRARWHGSRMRFAMPTGESASFETAKAGLNADLNRILSDLDVTIMDICEGLPNLVQTDDGFRFDPRVDIELLETGGGGK